MVPMGCTLLLASCDTQGNRVEVGVWGFGRGQEMWTIDHQIFHGNPAEDEVWAGVAEYLFERRFQHEGGQQMSIYASAIDSGGHHSNAVYDFARRNKARRVFAVRGRPFGEKAIKDGAGQVDIDWRGKRLRKGVILWHVGTNLAKDLLHSRLAIESPGAWAMSTCRRICQKSGLDSSRARCGWHARLQPVLALCGPPFVSAWKRGTAPSMPSGLQSIWAFRARRTPGGTRWRQSWMHCRRRPNATTKRTNHRIGRRHSRRARHRPRRRRPNGPRRVQGTAGLLPQAI